MNYDKKTHKNIVHVRDYYPPPFGPGKKDASQPQRKIG
jgi:hypothetical protein